MCLPVLAGVTATTRIMVGIAACLITGRAVPVEGADFGLATPHPEACALRVFVASGRTSANAVLAAAGQGGDAVLGKSRDRHFRQDQ